MATRSEMVDGLSQIFGIMPNSVNVIDRTLLDFGYRNRAKRGMAKHQMSPLDISMTALAVTMTLGSKGRVRAMEQLLGARHISEPDISFPMAFASLLEHVSRGERVRCYASFSQLESNGEMGLFVDGQFRIHKFSGNDLSGPPPIQTRITLYEGVIQDISDLVTPSYCSELSAIYGRLRSPCLENELMHGNTDIALGGP